MPEAQWCYLPNAKGEFAAGMKLKPNYLSLTGYRLPSEAEWEHACRARTMTSRYYGESTEVLDRYAWYKEDSQITWTLPVGSMRPNDFGLFDMLGNVMEWCQERHFPYICGEDSEDILVVTDQDDRILRVQI